MKLYGNLNNRLEETMPNAKNITVGMGATEYHWSDRTPYEVTEVKDQKHIKVRELKATRTDKNGMSDSQSYKFESDENKPEIELSWRNNGWYEVSTYSQKIWQKRAEREVEKGYIKTPEEGYGLYRMLAGLTREQYKAIDEGKTVKRYTKRNIVIGEADKYYDYSF